MAEKSTMTPENIKVTVFDHPFCVSMASLAPKGKTSFVPSDWLYEWFDTLDAAETYYLQLLNWARGEANTYDDALFVVALLDSQADSVSVAKVKAGGMSTTSATKIESSVRKNLWTIFAPAVTEDEVAPEVKKARRQAGKLESGVALSGKTGKAKPKTRKRVGGKAPAKAAPKQEASIVRKARKATPKKAAPSSKPESSPAVKPVAKRRNRKAVKKVTA